MLRDPALIPLSRQHQHGLALGVLTRRALAADASAANVAAQARRVVGQFELEFANHFEIEEQVLFPTCGPLPLVARLIGEHRALEALVERLRAAPTAELLEEFCALLAAHIRTEENELFEQIQRELPRAAMEAAGREIGRRTVEVCLLDVPPARKNL